MNTPLEIEEDNPVSFKNIGICTSRPTVNVLSNVSGYVVKGGMTAIMGGSGSGKTLLLEALSGRTPNLTITGDYFLDGMSADPKDIVNPVAYVPFASSLIGELTCRETLFNSAALRCNKPLDDINEDVERFLDILGVGEVADRPIGTYFTRGLSDGQKKLINIGAELVASPLVLLLDEPTNDMDSDIARESNMSVILSVSQPSARMMDLFDHIMLLGGGSMNFFGTTSEAVEYFSSIGFAPLDNHMPTDYFLQVSDPTYAPCNDFNFEGKQCVPKLLSQ
jgi:ABC-type multidrug transport system ATPase subunit